MSQPTKLFKPSSVGAGVSLLTVVLLMLGNLPLVLTFFICIVYAVVPFSLWQKHRTLLWRSSIILTCSVGFGIIALGLILEVADLKMSEGFSEFLPGFATLRLALIAGVVFLPLAGIGSFHSLTVAIKAKRRLAPANPTSR